MKIGSINNLSFKGIRIFENGMKRSVKNAANFFAGKMYDDKDVKALDSQGVDLFIINDGNSQNSFLVGFMPKKEAGKGYRHTFYKAKNAEKLLKQKIDKHGDKNGSQYYDVEVNDIIKSNISMVKDDFKRDPTSYREIYSDEQLFEKISNAKNVTYWKADTRDPFADMNYWK